MLLQSLIYIFILSSCAESDQKEFVEDGGIKYADVTKVTVNETGSGFTFSVTLASPDTGCEQFADWWEVVSEDGNLIYRRILLHSHVNENPFTRSGGPVDIEPDQKVYIRGHMNNTGYGGKVMGGTIADGFTEMEFTSEHDEDLAKTEPLPKGCAN